MAIPLRRRMVGGISLLAIGAAVLMVGLVLGFRDAVDRNFGRPKVVRGNSPHVVNGVRDEELFLTQRPWPLFWETATGYGFRYLRSEENGRPVWAIMEAVLTQGWPDSRIVQRVVCFSDGHSQGRVEVLDSLKCECSGSSECTAEDLEYLVRTRTMFGIPRSHPHVPLITRNMPNTLLD